MKPTLHPRQRQVLALIAQGEPQKAIACELGISIKTVQWYISEMYKKLDIHDRVEVAHYCLHHGIVRNLYA